MKVLIPWNLNILRNVSVALVQADPVLKGFLFFFQSNKNKGRDWSNFCCPQVSIIEGNFFQNSMPWSQLYPENMMNAGRKTARLYVTLCWELSQLSSKFQFA